MVHVLFGIKVREDGSPLNVIDADAHKGKDVSHPEPTTIDQPEHGGKTRSMVNGMKGFVACWGLWDNDVLTVHLINHGVYEAFVEKWHIAGHREYIRGSSVKQGGYNSDKRPPVKEDISEDGSVDAFYRVMISGNNKDVVEDRPNLIINMLNEAPIPNVHGSLIPTHPFRLATGKYGATDAHQPYI